MLNEKKKSKFFEHYSLMEKKRFLFVYLMIAFPVVQVIVMYFWVNISSIIMAFQAYPSNNFTFENFRMVFDALSSGSDRFGLNPRLSLINSVIIFFYISILATVVNLLTTYMLTKHTVGARAFRVIYSVPGLVGGVVFASVMQSIYSYNGLAVSILDGLGFNLPVIVREQGLLGNEGTAFNTLMFQTFFMTIGGGSMVLAGAYMRIPQEVFESAKIEGCGLFRETFQLAIPCAWPTISTLTVFSLCGIFTSDMNFYMYSNGSGNFGMTSIGFYLYKFQTMFAEGSGASGYNYLSALGVCITIVTVPLVLLGRWALNKFNEDVEF